MGGTVAIQTQCCLMKREEYDEDVSDGRCAQYEAGEAAAHGGTTALPLGRVGNAGRSTPTEESG